MEEPNNNKSVKKVLFFGGYLSTLSDINSWLKSAQWQSPEVNFRGFPYPHGALSDDMSAVKGFGMANIIKLSSEIDNNPDDEYIIVGHSSGCAIANDVAYQVKPGTKTRLICLDGFRPSVYIMSKVATTCWSAKNGSMKSRNYTALQTATHFKVFECENGDSSWGLHFSLVNKNAGHIQKIVEGYKNCLTNLCWL